LVDLDYSVEFDIATESDRMAVIAAKPLTDEKGWLEMNLGKLIMFNNGIAYTDATAIEHVEVEG
jgi:predicted glutamine amidotransferase